MTRLKIFALGVLIAASADVARAESSLTLTPGSGVAKTRTNTIMAFRIASHPAAMLPGAAGARTWS